MDVPMFFGMSVAAAVDRLVSQYRLKKQLAQLDQNLCSCTAPGPLEYLA